MARSLAQGKKGGSPRHEDAFVEKILQATTWAQHNLGTVIVTAVVLGLGIAGILYYRNYQATVREQAAVELQRLGNQLGAVDEPTTVQRLESFVDRYGGTVAADEARLLLARVRLDAGQAAAAIEALQPVADEHAADTPLGYAARSLLATAGEAQGELERALRLYAELGEEARLPFQRRRALGERGRLLLQAGRFAEAAALYEELAGRAAAADAPEEAAFYRLRYGEARALAAADRPAAGAAEGSGRSSGRAGSAGG